MLKLFGKFGKPSAATISSLIIIIIGLLSLVFLLIWNNNSPVDNEKKIYFVDNISSAHRHVIDRFNQLHKGEIKVEVINLSFEKFSTNERKELLARYLRSKNDKIDVFSADQIWAHRFARWAEPLDKYFNDNDRKQILPNALQSCLYKNQLVAVPFFMDIGIMFYRRDLIEKIPGWQDIEKKLNESITWEDFIKLGEKVNNGKNPFYTFQADNYEGLMCSYIELLEDQNKSLFEDGKIQLTSPESERALTLLVDLVNKYHISPSNVSEFKENNSYHYYIQNNGLFLRAWPNFPRDYSSLFGKDPRVSQVVKVPIPHFAGFKPVAITGGWNLMISKYSKQIPEALEFVKFLMSEEAQKIMYEEGGFLPTNNQIYYDSSYTSKYPDLKFFKNYLQNGIHRPYMVDYTRISDVISHFLHLAVKKEITVKKALQEAQYLINNENFNVN